MTDKKSKKLISQLHFFHFNFSQFAYLSLQEDAHDDSRIGDVIASGEVLVTQLHREVELSRCTNL